MGSVVNLLESAGYSPYIIIAHDHHGEGLTTLMRKNFYGGATRFASTPSSSYNSKYINSTLNTKCNTFYSELPVETQGKIVEVGVPTRANGSDSTIVDVASHIFPLSAMEYFGEGGPEGTYIPYFVDNETRIGFIESTGEANKTLTRSIIAGMTGYARTVTAGGNLSNQTCATTGYLRPVCCVGSNIEVNEEDGVFMI